MTSVSKQISNESQIFFDNNSIKYAFLNNHYVSDIIVDGKNYYHVEGYLQSQKYKEYVSLSQRIRFTMSPRVIVNIVKDIPIDETLNDKWEDEIYEKLIRRILLIKFTTCTKLMNSLVSTGTKELLFNDYDDSYWGIGNDGDGDNMLGKILMDIRRLVTSMTYN